MIQAWQLYNRQLAENNKLVAHGRPRSGGLSGTRESFFRENNFFEMEAAQVGGIDSPYVVCGSLAGRPSGVPPIRRKTIKARMYFLGHVAESLDDMEQVQEQTFDVMMDWISAYLKDYEVLGACGPFQKLDINKMFWQEVGPMQQWEYGWQLDLEFLQDGGDFNYDPAKWFNP